MARRQAHLLSLARLAGPACQIADPVSYTHLDVYKRQDYHLATPKIAETALQVGVYKEQRFSDHAPLWVDYDYAI